MPCRRMPLLVHFWGVCIDLLYARLALPLPEGQDAEQVAELEREQKTIKLTTNNQY